MSRRGRLVVLLGIDGTGKSTQAERLKTVAERRGLRTQVVWSRWDPLLLRPVINLGRKGISDDASDDAELSLTLRKRRLFSNPVLRVAWRWVASLDHFVQVAPKIALALRYNDIVISDRYYFDTLVDMGVNFGGTPGRSGFLRLFPKPDEVILLDGDESVLRERNSRANPLSHLLARRPRYLAMSRELGWHVVDATAPVDDVSAQLERLVFGP
jgi:thymidylate kinase